jgi:hypothetical protein
VREYAASDWQYLDWCTDWPTAPADHPAGPPRPPGGSYPGLPVLVLTGELDTITTPAEGTLVARQFPQARRVLVRNSFHVTAVGDTDDCAQRIVRDFVTSPRGTPPAELRACPRQVPPIRVPGSFPTTVADVRPAVGGSAAAGRVARTAALTVADLTDRWWNNYSGHGVGLRGGRWTYAGYDRVRFDLTDVRLVSDLSVSGRAVWDRDAETMAVDLVVRADGVYPSGRLRGRWDTRAVGATAVLTGSLGGHWVRVTLPAP